MIREFIRVYQAGASVPAMPLAGSERYPDAIGKLGSRQVNGRRLCGQAAARPSW
jgi:hypothetical protein